MSDVDELARLLEICARRGVTVTSAAVGSVRVEIRAVTREAFPMRPPDPDELAADEEHATYGAGAGPSHHYDPEEFARLTQELG